MDKNAGAKSRALTCIAAFLTAYWTGDTAFSAIGGHVKYTVASTLSTLAWSYVASRGIIRGFTTPPYLVILFASIELVTLMTDLLRLRFGLLGLVQVIHTILLVGFVWVTGTLPLMTLRPAHVARPGDIPSNTLTCPEDDVTLWSWSTFSFVEPLFQVADTKTIDEGDVWSLSPFFQHKVIFGKLLEYRARYPTYSLLHFLIVSNSLDLTIDFVLELWSAVIGFVPPYALKEILSALATDGAEARRSAFKWALLTFIAHLSFAQVDLFKGWHNRRCYERTRGQLFCILHHKSLKRQDISSKCSGEEKEQENADLGKIVNLMQGDAYAVAQRFWDFAGFFTAPIRLAISLVFLYRILGWSTFAGVAVILVSYILNYPLIKYSISVSTSSWKARDKRMTTVNELLQNIRFLKFYGWGMLWAQKAKDAREKELKWRVKENVVITFITFIWTWIPSSVALATFSCYTLIAGEQLTVAKAFSSLALFSYLQSSMMALPAQVFAFLYAYVSMKRIASFLVEAEVPDWASTLTAPAIPAEPDRMGFSQASFDWEKNDSDSTSRFGLGPLDITFPRGKLTLVSGATGSGKSAMLAALLGEMHCMSGKVFIDKTHHRVAYCGQISWLEHATIRDNIIYGSSRGFDQERYEAVIDACALSKDLDIFDAGDLTEIGEKGITLSGGQRARVALARALYSEAQCILLDDPLAAVDMHTAHHIVQNCFTGRFAADRTIILVTHHLSLCLPIASHFIELEDGKVVRQGPAREFIDDGVTQNIVTKTDMHTEILQNEADSLTNGTNPVGKTGDGTLIEEETRPEGSISWRAYYTYIRAAGMFCWFLSFVLLVLVRCISIADQVFLAKWSEAYEHVYPAIAQYFDYPWANFPSPDKDVKPWITVYLCISLVGASMVLLDTSLGLYASLQASRSIFNSLLQRLSRAPIRFFDVTPIGRILNRFTTDMNLIDRGLWGSSLACFRGVLDFVASMLVILFVVPAFAPFAIFIAWLYVRLAPSYIRTSRDLRRLELTSLSPAFAGFDELLHGITHIRAFGMEQRYQDRFYSKVDKFQSFDHAYWLVAGWLRWRYDCLGSVIVFASTMFALWSKVSDGFAAIVIVQAGIFANASRNLVSVAAQLELDYNSVERVLEYLNVDQEAPAIIEKSRPPAYWPSSTGWLHVENLTIQYAPHLPAALRNITFSVKPSEKIGVVGRTGSGKSTLALSLLRMIEPSSGRILLDDLDISTMGLEDLRTRVTIISQDVSLFSGTIRTNIDPLEEHSTEEHLEVIQRCHLSSVIKHTPTENEPSLLDMPVGPESLSAGEKQLVALARAILRRTNVIIMDEATSQIDTNLDDQIQVTVREEMVDAIVITIAHRLKTVMDYDRILVLDGGEIVEFDEPKNSTMKSKGERCSLFLSFFLIASAAAGPVIPHDDLGGIVGGFLQPDVYSPTTSTLPSGSSTAHGTFQTASTLYMTSEPTRSHETMTNHVTSSFAGTNRESMTLAPDSWPGSSTSSSSWATPSTTETTNYAQDASQKSPSEATQWKVIGITVFCITVVGAIMLAAFFSDTLIKLLKDVCLGGNRKRTKRGEETMVPDWQRRSWEYKIADEEGHRYPTVSSSLQSMTENKQKMDQAVSSVVTPPAALYLPELGPHPLDPLLRRPSCKYRN
ncbi:hypothetical protein APHAL10511_005891 [Amanita phalloides]|nr:hypothetical protein APHAL10511_005891 [Amanita phalloides]